MLIHVLYEGGINMKSVKRVMTAFLAVLMIMAVLSHPINTEAASGKISFSVNGVSLTVGEQKAITVSHVYGSNCYYSYRTAGNSNSSIASLKWGS